MSAPEQELKDAQYVVQCRTYFHASGKKEEKAEFRPVPIAAVTLVKNKTAKHAWGIEKFRPYLNPKRTVRHLGAVPRCSTNPDSMKGIRRGSTPPVGQKVRDSLLNYRIDFPHMS